MENGKERLYYHPHCRFNDCACRNLQIRVLCYDKAVRSGCLVKPVENVSAYFKTQDACLDKGPPFFEGGSAQLLS